MEEMKLVEADRLWGQVGERPGLGGTRGAQGPGPPRSLHPADTVKTCRVSTRQAKEGGGRGSRRKWKDGECTRPQQTLRFVGWPATAVSSEHHPPETAGRPSLPGPRHIYHTAQASAPCAGCKRVFPDFIQSFTAGITQHPGQVVFIHMCPSVCTREGRVWLTPRQTRPGQLGARTEGCWVNICWTNE